MARAKTKSAGSKSKKSTQLDWDEVQLFSGTSKRESVSKERALQLGYVALSNDHPRPKANKEYPLVVASSEEVGQVEYPSTMYKRLALDLYDFYIDDMPDFLSRNNEGLFVCLQRKWTKAGFNLSNGSGC